MNQTNSYPYCIYKSKTVENGEFEFRDLLCTSNVCNMV